MNSRRLKDVLLVIIVNIIAFAMSFALIMKVNILFASSKIYFQHHF